MFNLVISKYLNKNEIRANLLVFLIFSFALVSESFQSSGNYCTDVSICTVSMIFHPIMIFFILVIFFLIVNTFIKSKIKFGLIFVQLLGFFILAISIMKTNQKDINKALLNIAEQTAISCLAKEACPLTLENFDNLETLSESYIFKKPKQLYKLVPYLSLEPEVAYEVDGKTFKLHGLIDSDMASIKTFELDKEGNLHNYPFKN